MPVTIELQQQRILAQAERHLEIGSRCLVRQLHAMSQLRLVGADMALAEAALKTMLRTYELMVQDK
jgi:hypothetical protein